jgi:hypothetical protein
MSHELQAHADNPAEATELDRRVRVRYAQPLRTFCQHGAGDLDQVWWMGTLRDISGAGIGLLLQHRFEPGTLLTLELENSDRTASQTLHVRVVRVGAQPGCWLLGCELVQELPEPEVQDFLDDKRDVTQDERRGRDSNP